MPLLSNNKPKHEQLKAEIIEWIRSGRYQPYDKLPTELELARLNGVSRQTVRQSIGALEREGWLVRKQGSGTYVSAAAERKQQAMATVGVITTYISDYIFPQIVHGAETVFRAAGYHMLVSSTDNLKSKERDSLELLMAGSIQGLIIEPTTSALGNPNLDMYMALEAAGIPYLMINACYPELDCPSVMMNDEKGGYLAASHLIELGHTRIAGFFKTDDLQGAQRLKGYLRAHHETNTQLYQDQIVQYATGEKWIKPREQALALLSGAPADRPTAIVCYNDEMAVILLEAIREAGLRVPDDVSIVGFDDAFLATATETKLTTIAHPKAELGMKAADLLLEMIASARSNRVKSIVYEPELIVRQSTRRREAEKRTEKE